MLKFRVCIHYRFLYFVTAFFLISGSAPAASPSAQPSTKVIYPAPESAKDRRSLFYWRLLRIALEKTKKEFGPYVLEQDSVPMSSTRTEAALKEANPRISITARATSPERERELTPVRIPLDMGLLGYRVFLIHKDSARELQKVKTLADLKKFTVGQGTTWVDVQILEEAGFTVIKGSNYDGLFQMLRTKRFDLFSRSVIEVLPELQDYDFNGSGIEIESRLLLYYPLPRYFFTAPTASGQRLAKRVEAGLLKMHKDGTFKKMFDEYKRPIEEKLRLKSRIVFKIPNPTLTPETPFDKKFLWYTP